MKQIESFFWGIVAALGALVFQIFLLIFFSSFMTTPGYSLTIEQIFLLPGFILAAAVIEEIFKYIMISKRVDTFSLEKSYIINSILVGFGFFLVEMLIFSKNFSQLPTREIVAQIAILHMGTAGLMGYITAIRNPKKIGTFLIAITAATFFHATYNLLALSDSSLLKYASFSLLIVLIFLNVLNFFKISSRLAQ